VNAKKVPQNGSSDQVPVDVLEANELWSTYKLSDGTVLKIKTILIEVSRAKNEYNNDGDPVYSIKSANIADAAVPNKLKKKK
jgi:hypothetical protein